MGSNIVEYWVSRDGDNLGPYSLAQLEKMQKKGEFAGGELVCEVGADQWSSIKDVLGGDDSIQEFKDKFEDSPKIIIKKRSGMSLNAILTGVLFFLLLVCGGLYLFVQFRINNSMVSNPAKGDDSNIEELIKLAKDVQLLEEKDGLMLVKESNSLFSGWAKSYYSKGDTVSSLVQYKEGKAIQGHSLNKLGGRTEETTLMEGTGQVVLFFEGAGRRMESSYRAGVLNGRRTRWYESGEKEIEESWNDGELNGQRLAWDKNGQKVEQVFYLDGLKSGPFSYWSKDGQKYDEGIHKNGKLEGKRIQWSRDGSERFEEFYENGELIPQNPTEEPEMEKETEVEIEIDPVLAKLLSLAGKDEGWISKAQSTSKVVNFIMERFKQSQIPGHEIFADLATSLFEYAKQGGKDEKMVMSGLDWIRNQWGIEVLFNEEGFVLSELPESVTLGPLTWQRVDYAQDFLGSLQGESRDLVVGDLEDLFKSVGVNLGRETESISKKVERQIWEQFVLKAEDAKNANLVLKNGDLVFDGFETKKMKKIDPSGNSIFETVETAISYTFSQTKAQGKKIGPFLNVLDNARAKFEELKNGTLRIRKYTDLVILSDQLTPNGKALLYPNVTIQFAGLAPLGDNTTIRFTKVELGGFVEEPESSIEGAGMPF